MRMQIHQVVDAGLFALSFWLAYVLTRPLGASFGDLFSQPVEYGGLGFGTTVTTFIFIGCIAIVVVYMTIIHESEETIRPDSEVEESTPPVSSVSVQ